MILRKPYAFLIKNFRLIHMFLSIALAFLSLKTTVVLDFFRDYISGGWYSFDGISTSDYLGLDIIVIIMAIIVLSAAVVLLFQEKKKPINFYVIIFLVTIATGIIFLMAGTDIMVVESDVVLDANKARVTRDLLFLISLTHYPLIIFSVLRTLGFDLKKFDFGKDAVELEIDIEDQAEFEVEFKLDTNKIKRNIIKRKRKINYALQDNVALVIVGGAIIGVVMTVSLVSSLVDISKKYYEYNEVPIYPFVFTVQESYLTDKDYKNNTISEGNVYAVLKIKVKNEGTATTELPFDRINLYDDELAYAYITNKNDTFQDFGTPISDLYLEADEEVEFTLIYELPYESINDSLTFRYREYISWSDRFLEQEYITIQLEPTNLSIVTSSADYQLDEKILLNKSIYGSSSLNITGYDMAQSFHYEYSYCKNDLCASLTENIAPSINSTAYNDIMKITGEFNLGEGATNSEIDSLHELLTLYGKLEYTYEGTRYTLTSFISATDNETISEAYLEVPEEVNDADKIKLIIQIRNAEYTFVLKGEE